MDTRTKLETLAVKMGTALGKADRTARTISNVARFASEELFELTKQIESLANHLKYARERLTHKL